MKNSCIFFDLDGTLSDSSEGIYKSLIYALSQKSIIVDDMDTLKPFIGPPMLESFQQYYKMSLDEARESYKVFQSRYRRVGKFENTLYEGMKETLENLSEKGYFLGVATSKPEIFAKEILAYFDIQDFFSIVKGASLDGELSKKTDILALAIKEAQQKNPNIKDLYMVGDRCYDMLAAKALNCVAIGVTYGFGSYDELITNGANYIVNKPIELIDYFK